MVAQPDWLEYGAPTLDRPFGVKLWPLFNAASQQFMGYKADAFRFVPGQTPMSTMPETAIGLISYYLIVFCGREVMKNREAMKLNGLFKIHNFYLTVISGGLLALFLEQLIPEVARNGVFHAICSYDGGWTSPLVTLYYVR